MQIGTTASDSVAIMLFVISVVLSLLILIFVFVINRHYSIVKNKRQEMDLKKRSRFSLIFTIARKELRDEKKADRKAKIEEKRAKLNAEFEAVKAKIKNA